jgi:hypothetical protein
MACSEAPPMGRRNLTALGCTQSISTTNCGTANIKFLVPQDKPLTKNEIMKLKLLKELRLV